MSVIDQSITTHPTRSNMGTQSVLEHDQLLRMLVAQIQNQNKFFSKDVEDKVQQRLHFKNYQGLHKLQDSMHQMSNSFQSNFALQASALVGRKVMVKTTTCKYKLDHELYFAVHLANTYNSVDLLINDLNGHCIKQISINPKLGFILCSWDGTDNKNETVLEKSYQIIITATQADETYFLDAMLVANVDSVSLSQNNKQLKLNVAHAGLVSLEQVKQIFI